VSGASAEGSRSLPRGLAVSLERVLAAVKVFAFLAARTYRLIIWIETAAEMIVDLSNLGATHDDKVVCD